MSDEHKHIWKLMPCSWDMSIKATCVNVCSSGECEIEMDRDEIEKRINATEILSADLANYAGYLIHHSMDELSRKNPRKIFRDANMMPSLLYKYAGEF